MTAYNVVSQDEECTVVSQYEIPDRTRTKYQSEAELERLLIDQLAGQGYIRSNITNEAEMIDNLRKQLEALNDIRFSEKEWESFFRDSIARSTDSVLDKTERIQRDYVQVLHRDDGSTKNIKLIDKQHIHRNTLQIIHQFEMGIDKGARHDNRYDVTILVNGLPLVQIELKRRGVRLREAYNQIDRYHRDSFTAGHKLFGYVQIFVISNGTETKYYANRVDEHGKLQTSFAFANNWADARNKAILDLEDFACTFLARRTLLNVLTRYCVFTEDRQLLVMRPYQIVATERILCRILRAVNSGWKDADKGGYIWHATGSGKTLTSFKTAQLASKMDGIDKVLFVVDRQDLDYQTMREYDKLEKGAANGTKTTAELETMLTRDDVHIIVTTIQKLDRFVKSTSKQKHPAANKRIVIIYDECHRSQSGDMHANIRRYFTNELTFGCTGTPVFAVNSNVDVGRVDAITTEQTFGQRLHSYTIVHAINDHNVLPFRVQEIKTMDADEAMTDEKIVDIDRDAAYRAPERVSLIVKYILDHFDVQTNRKLGRKFNSIFATDSIASAKVYYAEFKKQLASTGRSMRIALIYSSGANMDEDTGLLCDEDSDSTSALDTPSRDFLDRAIQDYNATFGSAFSTDGDGFRNYYRDVSKRVKNCEVDMLIVVNMFLTGFDAKCVNTLWVDKPLRMHGLLQTFSRTNRIYDETKPYGNIVCFRPMTANINQAMSIFGDDAASGIVILRKYEDYYSGYTDENGYHDGYTDIVKRLLCDFPLSTPIVGEAKQKEFLKLFGSWLQRKNILRAFDEFTGCQILSEAQVQDYTSLYQDVYDERKKRIAASDIRNVNDDIEYEALLIKQFDVDADAILELVKKYHDIHATDKEMEEHVLRMINASPLLRSKKQLIMTFVKGLVDGDDVIAKWQEYVADEYDKAVKALCKEEDLHEQKVYDLLSEARTTGYVRTTGMAIPELFVHPMSFFTNASVRCERNERVKEKLADLFTLFDGT